jgi:hypothetical protein
VRCLSNLYHVLSATASSLSRFTLCLTNHTAQGLMSTRKSSCLQGNIVYVTVSYLVPFDVWSDCGHGDKRVTRFLGPGRTKNCVWYGNAETGGPISRVPHDRGSCRHLLRQPRSYRVCQDRRIAKSLTTGSITVHSLILDQFAASPRPSVPPSPERAAAPPTAAPLHNQPRKQKLSHW